MWGGMKIGLKTDPDVIELIGELKIAGREKNIWRDVAERLEKPRGQRPQINVGKIADEIKGDEIALVPGKVLGAGEINRSVRVAALSFSDMAYQKLLESGSEAISIGELLRSNPEVSKIRILR
jgi:large subunit ribosomal protein L18e